MVFSIQSMRGLFVESKLEISEYGMLMNSDIVHTDTSLSYCKMTKMGLPLITEPRSCSP